MPTSSSEPPPPQPPNQDKTPVDPILLAITDLSQQIAGISLKSDAIEEQIDSMASKQDLVTMQTNLLTRTKGLISDAVHPLETEITLLHERMTAMETTPQATSGSSTSNKTVKDLQHIVNQLDPALRRVSFITWPKSVSTEKRIEMMGIFMTTKYKMYVYQISVMISQAHTIMKNYQRPLGWSSQTLKQLKVS